ncbi:MAG: S9 family peptidase [Candidatus Eremiobacteraeota bacterium]|nr:S9 family peptidase [Candidatus Eremiobacteraeota bacterium]
MYRLVGVSAPQLSPDGTRVAAIVSRSDRAQDRTLRELDVVDVRTGAVQVLLQEGAPSQPRWSPDGTRIAVVARLAPGEKTGAQVMAVPVGDGAPVAMTSAPGGVDTYSWRPDGAAIAYTATDAPPARTGDARFLDAYHPGNEGALARGPAGTARVWLQPLDGGGARALTRGAGSVTSGEARSTLSFSPDGSRLAYLHAPTNVLNDADAATVRIIDVASGVERELNASAAPVRDGLFSPDGARMAYVHSPGDAQIAPTDAYVTSASGGTGHAVSRAIDRRVRDIAWQPRSATLFFTAVDGTRNVLYRWSGGTPVRVDLGRVSIESGLDGAIGADGAIVFAGETAQRPGELYYRSPSGTVRRLTELNAFVTSLALARSERVRFTTSLGIRGDAVLWLPPAVLRRRRAPLVLVLHGGPTSASSETFDTLAQLMAARGWLVLQPNYRGSDNLGARYQAAVRDDKMVGPSRDIRAALDAVRARGIVDEQRVAVSGWSYGGGLTCWLIGHYHDWRAAVAGASVTDIADDYATADDPNADRALIAGSPFDRRRRADAEAQSPLVAVGAVTTPVLLMTLRGDTRVSPVGTYEFARALRDLHKRFEFVAYPIDGHFPGDPVRRVDVYRRWIAFIAARFGD